jgi:hypothetical protein
LEVSKDSPVESPCTAYKFLLPTLSVVKKGYIFGARNFTVPFEHVGFAAFVCHGFGNEPLGDEKVRMDDLYASSSSPCSDESKPPRWLL